MPASGSGRVRLVVLILSSNHGNFFRTAVVFIAFEVSLQFLVWFFSDA